jgi:hypothetical protein
MGGASCEIGLVFIWIGVFLVIVFLLRIGGARCLTHGSGVAGACLLQCACTFEAGRRRLSLSAVGETLVAADAGGSWGWGRDMGGCEARGEGRGIGDRGVVYDLLVLRGKGVLGDSKGQ